MSRENPLISSKKRPKVSIVIGKVRKIRIGRTTALTIASKRAVRIAVNKSST